MVRLYWARLKLPVPAASLLYCGRLNRIIDTRSLGWLFWMSWRAPPTPIFIGYIEMSWVVPGRMPVSDRNWIIVIGPNQSRCRGRSGLSL